MINFTGKYFPKDIILMAVRWYIAYPLSYRHIEELMAERNVKVDHAFKSLVCGIYCAVRKKHKKQVNRSWRMDEHTLKLKVKMFTYIVLSINLEEW